MSNDREKTSDPIGDNAEETSDSTETAVIEGDPTPEKVDDATREISGNDDD